MKRQIILIISLLLLSISCCQKINVQKGTPKCVARAIKDFENTTACKNGASVKKYTFQAKLVYVFDPGNCGADMASKVVDNNCITLGTLGGITGNTKINGVDFSNAVFQSIVWEN